MTEDEQERVYYNVTMVDNTGRRFIWASGFISLAEARSELSILQSNGFTGTYTIERLCILEIERVTL